MAGVVSNLTDASETRMNARQNWLMAMLIALLCCPLARAQEEDLYLDGVIDGYIDATGKDVFLGPAILSGDTIILGDNIYVINSVVTLARHGIYASPGQDGFDLTLDSGGVITIASGVVIDLSGTASLSGASGTSASFVVSPCDPMTYMGINAATNGLDADPAGSGGVLTIECIGLLSISGATFLTNGGDGGDGGSAGSGAVITGSGTIWTNASDAGDGAAGGQGGSILLSAGDIEIASGSGMQAIGGIGGDGGFGAVGSTSTQGGSAGNGGGGGTIEIQSESDVSVISWTSPPQIVASGGAGGLGTQGGDGAGAGCGGGTVCYPSATGSSGRWGGTGGLGGNGGTVELGADDGVFLTHSLIICDGGSGGRAGDTGNAGTYMIGVCPTVCVLGRTGLYGLDGPPGGDAGSVTILAYEIDVSSSLLQLLGGNGGRGADASPCGGVAYCSPPGAPCAAGADGGLGGSGGAGGVISLMADYTDVSNATLRVCGGSGGNGGDGSSSSGYGGTGGAVGTNQVVDFGDAGTLTDDDVYIEDDNGNCSNTAGADGMNA